MPMKYLSIDENNLIEKRNVLNEMNPGRMDLQEIRFFSIYLSKINPRDLKTRIVDFPLSDFVKIMDIKKVNVSSVQNQLAKLLSKVVFIPRGKEEYDGFQLFKKCKVYKDNITNIWRVKIDAHDDALPLMFDFKERYFKYELWNALSLSSPNQIRMYEILKQYEKIGQRIIQLDELKKLIGVDKKKYKRFNNFREYVIDSAKKALLEHTDIYFEYETMTQIGRKVTAIKFFIHSNKKYKKKLSLDEFIQNKYEPQIIDKNCEMDELDDKFSMFTDMFENEFTRQQVEVLYQMAIPFVSRKCSTDEFDISMCNYFRLLYKKLKCTEIHHPFAYVKKLISIDLDTISNQSLE